LSRKKRRETINDWLTRRHQLIVRNEENFEEKRTITYNNAKALVIIFFLFIFTFFSAILLDRFYFSHWVGTLTDSNIYKRQLEKMSREVDSLEVVAYQTDSYMKSLQAILQGENPDDNFKIDSINTSEVSESQENLEQGHKIDQQIRDEFEASETVINLDNRFSELLLFPPVDSYSISQKYDVKTKHYGIDLLTKKDQIVSSIAQGIVIFSDWSIEGGNTLVIQHANELISVYKHSAVLLKKSGEFVQPGDPIAIVGNSGSETSGEHLHFEIWFEGEPFNPENVIRF